MYHTIFEGLPQRTVARMEKCLEPGKEIRLGCRFGGEDLAIIQLSREMAGNVTLAKELCSVIEKENVRRAYMGREKIAYRIETSERLADQFADVSTGGFELTAGTDVVQSVDMGRVCFASRPVGGKE